MKYFFCLIICLPLLFTCNEDKTHIVHREEIDEQEDLAPNLRFPGLFEKVQMEGVFDKSSTFANAVPKAFTKEIMKAYKEQSVQEGFDLKKFVATYFETKTSVELSDLNKTDLKEYCENAFEKMKMQSIAAKGSVFEMTQISVASKPDTYPELDYAESYFNMLGSDALGEDQIFDSTPKNIVYMLNTYECVPRINRSYSLKQSSAPYLSAMVDLLEPVHGERILKFYLGGFFKEHQFWMKSSHELVPASQINHSVKMKDGEVLNRYWSESYEPRIDHYREDKLLAERVGNEKILREVRAIAESNWLESSRWGMSNDNYEGASITNLIPVDLNALLYNLESNISRAYTLLNQEPRADFFKEKAAQRKKALMKYCWNDADGYFYDYDYAAQQQTNVVSIAGIYPLFFEMVDSKQAKRAIAKLESQLLKAGGVSSTNSETGLHWDAPFGKATFQWIAYKALKNYKEDALADQIKERWINSQKKIFEKNETLPEFTPVMKDFPAEKESTFATSSASILLAFLKE